MKSTIYFKIIIPSLCLFFITHTFASNKWLSLNSLAELKQLKQKNHIIKKLKFLCLLQLKKKGVPYSCYPWIKQISFLKKNTELIYYLNEKCLEFSVFMTDLKNIKKILKQKHLSLICRKSLYKQKNLIEYKLRDDTPKNIFKWYLKEDF